MGKVILFEDDQRVIDAIMQAIKPLGHEVTVSPNYHEGFEKLTSEKYDLVILQISPIQSINCSPLIKIEEDPLRGWTSSDRIRKFCISSIQNVILEPEIIVIAREEISNEAKSAAESGVFDYIQIPYRRDDKDKPIYDYEGFKNRLTASVIRAFSVFSGIDLNGIIGRDYKARKAMESLADASRTNFNVLITGETGTGKKLFARNIHDNSQFKNGPFIVIECASNQKLDDILFKTKNLVISGTPNPGSILFNDIHYMPIDVQIELFDYSRETAGIESQNRELSQNRPRIIASTTKNKEDLIEKGQFLENLFNELSFFHIILPPLRERTNDIPALTEYFVHLYNSQSSEPSNYRISKEFITHLEAYAWPGNINELINVIDLAILNAAGCNILMPVHLPEKIISLNLETSSRRSDPLTGKGISVFSTAGRYHFQKMAENRKSETLNLSNNKKREAKTIKREDFPRISTDIIEDKPVEPHPQKFTKKSTEDSKDRVTINFYQSGEYWTIGEKGNETLIKEKKGFSFISLLLKYPNKPIRSYVLFNMAKCLPGFVAANKALEKELNTSSDIIKPLVEEGKLSPKKILDEIERLNQKLDSDDYDNQEEALTIKEDIDFLKNMITYKTTKKGQIPILKRASRDHKSQSELVRINVYKRIDLALEKIHEKLPSLALYLNNSTIKTGDTCCYAPVLGQEPTWILKKLPPQK
jgi:two-component system, NtrC family, response regulator